MSFSFSPGILSKKYRKCTNSSSQNISRISSKFKQFIRQPWSPVAAHLLSARLAEPCELTGVEIFATVWVCHLPPEDSQNSTGDASS